MEDVDQEGLVNLLVMAVHSVDVIVVMRIRTMVAQILMNVLWESIIVVLMQRALTLMEGSIALVTQDTKEVDILVQILMSATLARIIAVPTQAALTQKAHFTATVPLDILEMALIAPILTNAARRL